MKNAYSVGQINSYIKNMFSQDYLLRSVYVKGEVSNVKYHSSGHIYFTMKDNVGTLPCVMFARKRAGLGFILRDGQQIVCGGRIEVYERDGKYQLYAEDIVLDGEGQLYERFEQLKRELADAGMFAPEYKREIPKFVQTLGVVTAPTGAAIRDIINVSKRRNPFVQIVLYPAQVQGEGAAESVARGIATLSERRVDVIIAGRGGGSIEDLWAFNEEIVANAIFNSEVPVISAVGHETDTTIADFVADLRAPTPSAAAELAVFDYRLFVEQCRSIQDDLQRSILRILSDKKNMATGYRLKLELQSPMMKVREYRNVSATMNDKLKRIMENKLKQKRHELEMRIEKLNALSPILRLNSGYAFVENHTGGMVKSILDVEIDEKVKLHLKDGVIEAIVTDKKSVSDRLEISNG